jgi:hypothetical protein
VIRTTPVGVVVGVADRVAVGVIVGVAVGVAVAFLIFTGTYTGSGSCTVQAFLYVLKRFLDIVGVVPVRSMTA